MKNFRQLLCLIFLFLMLFQSACKGTNDQSAPDDMTDLDNCQKGFILGFGSSITQSPEGYYIKLGNYLMFFNPDLKDYTIVCNRPDCLHHKEPMETAANCNAFFNGYQLVQYYDGFLYVPGFSTTELKASSLYKISLDGSSKTAIFTSPEHALAGFTIHQGYAYVYEKVYPDDETLPVVLTISSFPLEHPDRKEVLFSYDSKQEADINNIVCKDDSLYFKLFDTSEDYIFSQSYKIDLKTKELSTLFSNLDDFEEVPDNIVSQNYFLGPDQLISCVQSKTDSEPNTLISTYYSFHMDGSFDHRLTEKNYEKLNKNTHIEDADDQYIYIIENITVTDGQLQPYKDPVLYIYEANGTLAGMVDVSQITPGFSVIPGNEDYLFIKEFPPNEPGSRTVLSIYYCVKKSELNGNTAIKPQKVISEDWDYYTSSSTTQGN